MMPGVDLSLPILSKCSPKRCALWDEVTRGRLSLSIIKFKYNYCDIFSNKTIFSCSTNAFARLFFLLKKAFPWEVDI